jgi:hypothetical protein
MSSKLGFTMTLYVPEINITTIIHDIHPLDREVPPLTDGTELDRLRIPAEFEDTLRYGVDHLSPKIELLTRLAEFLPISPQNALKNEPILILIILNRAAQVDTHAAISLFS